MILCEPEPYPALAGPQGASRSDLWTQISYNRIIAGVAELVYASALGADGGNPLEVQVLSPAQCKPLKSPCLARVFSLTKTYSMI